MRELITLKDGTVVQFDEVFNRYNDRIYLYCWKIVKEKEAAEDATTIAFQEIWQRRNDLENVKHLIDTLYKISKHRCIDYLRYKKLEEITNNYKIAPSEEEPLRLNTEIVASIYAYIQTFKDIRMRKAVYSFIVEAKNPREISELYSIPKKTVYEVIERGIKKLRTKFKPYKHLIYE